MAERLIVLAKRGEDSPCGERREAWLSSRCLHARGMLRAGLTAHRRMVYTVRDAHGCCAWDPARVVRASSH
eukprot:571512-Prymnesium_polylepis.1